MVGWNGLQWKFLIHLDFHKIIPKHLTFKETNLEKHIGMKIRMHLEKWFQPMVKWFISMFLRTICKGGYKVINAKTMNAKWGNPKNKLFLEILRWIILQLIVIVSKGAFLFSLELFSQLLFLKLSQINLKYFEIISWKSRWIRIFHKILFHPTMFISYLSRILNRIINIF